MEKVKFTFSQPVKLNRNEPVTEAIIDKKTSNSHNSLARDVQYIFCNALNEMQYNELKSVTVEVVE